METNSHWRLGKQNKDTVTLTRLARQIGGTPFALTDEQRQGLHVSAVIANNFTNYLYGVCFQILKDTNLPRTILQPLIEQTVKQLVQFNPEDIQTGPAIRGDSNTIAAHMKYLEQFPEYLKIYEVLSDALKKK